MCGRGGGGPKHGRLDLSSSSKAGGVWTITAASIAWSRFALGNSGIGEFAPLELLEDDVLVDGLLVVGFAAPSGVAI